MSGDVDTSCEYCRVYNEQGVWVRSAACGMSSAEHSRMARLRKQAEAEAHAIVVAVREQELVPRAIIRELYQNANDDVQALLDRSLGEW